jgi:hypothetical protein
MPAESSDKGSYKDTSKIATLLEEPQVYILKGRQAMREC